MAGKVLVSRRKVSDGAAGVLMCRDLRPRMAMFDTTSMVPLAKPARCQVAGSGSAPSATVSKSSHSWNGQPTAAAVSPAAALSRLASPASRGPPASIAGLGPSTGALPPTAPVPPPPDPPPPVPPAPVPAPPEPPAAAASAVAVASTGRGDVPALQARNKQASAPTQHPFPTYPTHHRKSGRGAGL